MEFGKGVGRGFVGAAKGTAHAITHPDEVIDAAVAAYKEGGRGITGLINIVDNLVIEPLDQAVASCLGNSRTASGCGESVGEAAFGVVTAGVASKVARGLRGSPGMDRLAEFSGTLRDAARGKGDFGVGSFSAAEANLLGEAWVGPGSTVARGGAAKVSADRLRQFRPPTYKPSQGRAQANLEWRTRPHGKWVANAHIDILDSGR